MSYHVVRDFGLVGHARGCQVMMALMRYLPGVSLDKDCVQAEVITSAGSM